MRKFLLLSFAFCLFSLGEARRSLLTARECGQCINTPGTKWCKPRDGSNDGICCDLNDPASTCQHGEVFQCSDSAEFIHSEAKLLCPNAISSCDSRVEVIYDEHDKKVLFEAKMNENDLCWFEIEPKKGANNTLNIEIFNLQNTGFEIYTESGNSDYEFVDTDAPFQAISLPIEKKVKNVYFLLQPSSDNATMSFVAEMAPNHCHEDDCEHHTLQHHVIEAVVKILIIDLILMILVSGIFYFIGFNQKLVLMRVKKFNEVQEKKTRDQIQAVNDEERAPVGEIEPPVPDLELQNTSLQVTSDNTYECRESIPALKNPGLGLVKDIFFKRESF